MIIIVSLNDQHFNKAIAKFIGIVPRWPRPSALLFKWSAEVCQVLSLFERKKIFFFLMILMKIIQEFRLIFSDLKTEVIFRENLRTVRSEKNFFLIFEIKNFIFDEKISNFC